LGILQSCFVKASEGPECQHSNGCSVLVSVVGIRKYRKVTNLENMTHDSDKSSLTDNDVCGLALSCRRKHFTVVHNSRRRRQMLPRKHCSTTFNKYRGLQLETKLAGYFWFVCNTFSL